MATNTTTNKQKAVAKEPVTRTPASKSHKVPLGVVVDTKK